MRYSEGSRRPRAYRQRIATLRKKMRGVQRRIEPQPVEDYTFAAIDGPRQLSQLFGGKRDLFVVHNMGSGCPYCTLWADGYNGLYAHMASRAAFVVSSPDSPGVQKRFARSRGWRFPMVSHQGTTFAEDMVTAPAPAAGCRESPRFGGSGIASSALPTRGGAQATTSVRCGTCSTCSRRGRPAGSPSCATRVAGARDRRPGVWRRALLDSDRLVRRSVR